MQRVLVGHPARASMRRVTVTTWARSLPGASGRPALRAAPAPSAREIRPALRAVTFHQESEGVRGRRWIVLEPRAW